MKNWYVDIYEDVVQGNEIGGIRIRMVHSRWSISLNVENLSHRSATPSSFTTSSKSRTGHNVTFAAMCDDDRGEFGLTPM